MITKRIIIKRQVYWQFYRSQVVFDTLTLVRFVTHWKLGSWNAKRETASGGSYFHVQLQRYYDRPGFPGFERASIANINNEFNSCSEWTEGLKG